jgi:hypothetical protein
MCCTIQVYHGVGSFSSDDGHRHALLSPSGRGGACSSAASGVPHSSGGFRPSNLLDVPRAYAPGTDMQYSNLTAHLLGVIVTRASEMDLKDFADTYRIWLPLVAGNGRGTHVSSGLGTRGATDCH